MRLRSAVCAAVLGLAVASPAASAFDITSFSAGLTDPGTAAAPATTNQLQAGAHPDVTFDVRFPGKPSDSGSRVADGSVKRVDANLPRGTIVNPAVAPTCAPRELSRDYSAACPSDTQVGVATVFLSDGNPLEQVGIYNVEPPPGVPAQFGFNNLQAVTLLRARVRSDGDYGLTARADQITQALDVAGVRVTLWGVPADPVHDASRYAYVAVNEVNGYSTSPTTSGLPRRAFTSNPGRCTGQPLAFTVGAYSWQDPGTTYTRETTTEEDGTPLTITGCDSLPFDPSVDVAPTTTAPDSPTGLDVSVAVPQPVDAGTRSSAHLKDLSLLLPDGMNVNPSSADGLASCTPAQIGLGTARAVACPDAASLGDVSLTTPLLDAPLEGKVYLASQGDNPFGTTLALYLVAEGQGVSIRLPGRVDADPATGRLRVTFADNPELPFSRLDVRLFGGDRAVLTTPGSCGAKTVTADVSPWSGGAAATLTDGFSIDCTAGLGAFTPGFQVGTASQIAGAFTPLAVQLGRADGQPALQDVSVTLPPGLLAKLSGVPLCTDPNACPATSKVGTATVKAGAGNAPYPVVGEVFLSGPYKGAPYGLVTRFRVIAGPLDLGTVVVRQALTIDPEDAHVTAVSDALPTILSGIPIRLRSLDLSLDRPGFAVNPTSCAAKTVTGTLGALGGAVAQVASRFQVRGCGDLPLRPQLRLSLTGGRKRLKVGQHPGVRARLTQRLGESNLRRVEVKLPLSLALDPDNARGLCEAADGGAREPRCPVSSAIGTASATSPLLPEPLKGPIYFVKGVRTTKTGKQVRTLPKLVLPLRGNGVQINVRANTTVRDGKLVTQFDGIPDTAISRFDLSLDGGGHGVLVATRKVCSTSRRTGVRFRGQSNRLTKVTRLLHAACGT